MTNELALVQNNAAALNKAFGFQGRPKPSIPVLKINGADDEDGVRAPKGTFVYDDGDRVLYAPAVAIRTFVKAYQYRLYTKEKDKNDMSIIGKDFKTEFRSMSGRIACGKMGKKKYFELGENVSSTQKFLQDNVKCKLLVFGLVSGTFTDLDTKKEVKVEDALFSWVVSQSGFMPIDGAITGIEKERRPVPLTPIKVTLKKDKNGSVTFFSPIPEVQNTTANLIVERDGGFLAQINGFIDDTNEFIESKYNASVKAKTDDNNFAEVGKTIENNPLDDAINDL